MSDRSEAEDSLISDIEKLESAVQDHKKSMEVMREILDITTAARGGSDEELNAAIKKVMHLIEESGLNL